MYIHSSYENNFTHFSLDLSNKGIRYKLVDSFNQEINHTILTVLPFLIEDNNSTITNVQLNTTKCDIADFLFRKDIIDETNNTKNYTCLSTEDNNNVINQSNITSNSYVSFYIAKCLNTTKNNRHCLSLEDIDILQAKGYALFLNGQSVQIFFYSFELHLLVTRYKVINYTVN